MVEKTKTETKAKVEKAVKAKPKKTDQSGKLLVVIRVRGQVNVSEPLQRTMNMLRLHKKNRCIVIPSTQTYIGMVNKVRDFCTFGEVDKETLQLLIEKRARTVGDNSLTEEFLKKNAKLSIKELAEQLFSLKTSIKDIEGLKQFFKLHPPIGGFERKGIKKPYSVGGTLGYRGQEINKLLRKML